MAKRSLESNGCQKRSVEKRSRLHCDQVARTKSIEILRELMDGQKNFADTWNTSQRSTSPTPHLGTRCTGTKTPSRWYATKMIAQLDRCEHEKIFSPLRFDKNKDDIIPFFRRTREYGKDHSMKHCEETWNGRAKVGRPPGRNLPLHHLHNNGGNTNTKTPNGANTKTLNGEITIGGKSDGCRLFQSHIGFVSQISRTDISECRARDGGWRQNTSSHAHFSQCCRCRAPLTFTRTCVWLKISQELCCPIKRIEIILHVSRMPEKLVTTQRSFSEYIGHSLVLEMKENGKDPATTSQKPAASQWNDWIVRTGWSSRIPRHKCAQPRNIQAKTRKKHYSLPADLGNIELILRTIFSANQLSVYGAVSSWCIDLSERMQRQISTGVNMSISKENGQLSQQLVPHEVGSLARGSTKTQGAAGNCWREHFLRFEMMTSEEQLRTVSEEAGFIRTVSEGMYHRTGEDVNDGFGNLIAPCREYTFSRTHPDSEAKLEIYKYTEIGPVLDVKVICHNAYWMDVHIPSTSEDTTNVWYPEAQTAAWMSYDTENQKIFLKKLLTNVCKIKIKSNRQFKKDSKVKSQMMAFLFMKGFGRT